MQFHELAAAETSTLTKAVSASLDKLAKAAAADAERQAAQLRAEAKTALDAAGAEQAALAATLEEERRAAEEQQRLLEDERKQRTQLAQQLKEQSAALAFADAARREAEEARQKMEAAAREKEASVRAAADRDIAAAQDKLHAAESAFKEAEAAHAEQQRTARAKFLKGALQPLDHLRTAFDRLRTAATTDEILQALLESLATEFTRVAVFDVNAHRLEVSRHTGFDGAGDMAKVVVPLTMQSPLTRAVKDGRVQGLTSRELTETTRALVGGSPAFVLVLPVPIRGEVKAVIYADDSDQAPNELVTAERRVRFAEILLWHTVPLLARLALEDEALGEFREYAASLVNDLESVYVADAAKHKGAELRKRLQLNLQYARRRFTERVQAEGPAAARLLDEQIALAIDRRGATPFGRDLAAAASGADADRHPQAAADAS